MNSLKISVDGWFGQKKSVYVAWLILMVARLIIVAHPAPANMRCQQQPIPNMYALIVGIDTYACDKISNLSGAVADAERINGFLRDDLAVPEHQITILRNEQATRRAIIHEFRALRANPNIDRLDPIMIYFAGHGTEVDTPNACTREGYKSKTQCLVPQDVGRPDEGGDAVRPIPDYTISALLYALAEEKGNNITVILDCCHSASTTRGVFNGSRKNQTSSPFLSTSSIPSLLKSTLSLGGTRARYIDPSALPQLMAHHDSDIHVRRTAGFPRLSVIPEALELRKSFQRGMRSHVLLAACGHSQQAFERRSGRGGYFTSYLLKYLRHREIDKLTYKTCVDDLPTLATPRDQTPVCEGEHVNRLFFNASAPEAHSSMIPIICEGSKYVLKAGTAQGIMPNSRFTIHKRNILGADNPDIGKCRIHAMLYRPSESVCRIGRRTLDVLDELCTATPDAESNFAPGFNFSVPKRHPVSRGTVDSIEAPAPRIMAFARLLDPKPSRTLDVYFTHALREAFQGNVAQLISSSQVGPEDQVELEAPCEEEADVVLGLGAQGVTFTVANPDEGSEPQSYILPHTVPASTPEVKSALESMLQWRWHALREPPDGIRPFQNSLNVNLYKLRREHDDDDDNLVPIPGGLNINGVATVTASTGEQYGLKVINNSCRSLYAYPFYFSTTNQSIRPLFFRVHGRDKVDAPLEIDGEMSLGCGDDDYLPFSFHPTSNNEICDNVLDIGIIRFFVTTSSADFDSVAQSSPFFSPASTDYSKNGFSDGLSFEPQPHVRPSLVGRRSTSATSPLLTRRKDIHVHTSEMAVDHELWDVVEMKVVVRVEGL